jgi:hypothetical protein
MSVNRTRFGKGASPPQSGYLSVRRRNQQMLPRRRERRHQETLSFNESAPCCARASSELRNRSLFAGEHARPDVPTRPGGQRPEEPIELVVSRGS